MNTFMCFTFLLTLSWGSKYSAEKNIKIVDFTVQDNPFRMRKVNLLWEKAKKRLSGTKLADLYADLHVHDKHEAALKKYRLENMDKDGLKEAQVNMAFREIMEKYDLNDLFDTEGRLSNQLPLHEEKVYFSDKKLQFMWQRAEEAGFSERDLQKLKEEFWHQQMKIDEINFLQRNLGIEDVESNELEDPLKSGKNADEKKTMNQDLKKKHKDIRAGYYNLEAKFTEFERSEQDFQDVRVLQLWQLAKKTNWTAEEIDSFKEELSHFEARLKKHDFLEDQLLRSAESLNTREGNHEKYQQLEEKTNNIGLKVKKLHSDLTIKVTKALSQHTEL